MVRTSRFQSSRQPRLERLEDRHALSGFGPGDGAYVEESWFGYYNAVQIQPSTQSIFVAGGDSGQVPPSPANSFNYPTAVARYDSGGNADTTFGAGGVAAAPHIV